MSEPCECCGGHHCEPDRYPTELGDSWTCPDCRLEYRSYDPHTAGAPAFVLKSIPVGTIGWTSRPEETP